MPVRVAIRLRNTRVKGGFICGGNCSRALPPKTSLHVSNGAAVERECAGEFSRYERDRQAPQPRDDEETDARVKWPAAADYGFDASGTTSNYEKSNENELAARHLVVFADAVATLRRRGRRIVIVI